MILRVDIRYVPQPQLTAIVGFNNLRGLLQELCLLPQFQMKQPLTVIVPCKNERDNIRSCIDSFLLLADEILIADSGSTDFTREIAQQFDKTRLIERDYRTSGDFKNWAIPQARHEWVLIVDADERITPELAEEIQLELSRGPASDGYWIYRDNHFMAVSYTHLTLPTIYSV